MEQLQAAGSGVRVVMAQHSFPRQTELCTSALDGATQTNSGEGMVPFIMNVNYPNRAAKSRNAF